MSYTKDDITQADSSDIYSWLRYVKARQGYYLDSTTIEELVAFIYGYVTSSQSGSDANNIWFAFDQFKAAIAQKYPREWEKQNGKLSKVFSVLENSQNKPAVDIFWIEWEEYEKTASNKA